MKFLVIRFSSIGDIVLTTPAIRCLKLQVEGAEVHFLTKRSFKAVTEANLYIDKFHYYQDNLQELIEILKAEKYDCIIDLHKNFRSYRIRWALNTKVLAFRKLSLAKFLLTRFHINIMPDRHIVDRCVDALKPLGVKNDGRGMDYFIPDNEQIAATDIPLSHSAGYIALVIGASYATKKLPIDKLKALCEAIAYPIILIGGKEDEAAGAAVAAIDTIKVYNACSKFNLHESARLVQQSKLVIAHDTGLLYIACAFNKPVLAIWGATSPLLDVAPYYAVDNNLQNASVKFENFIVPHLNCQPCSNYGTRTCPRGHFKCMELQDVAHIAASAMQRLLR